MIWPIARTLPSILLVRRPARLLAGALFGCATLVVWAQTYLVSIPWAGLGAGEVFGPGDDPGNDRVHLSIAYTGVQVRPMVGIDLPVNAWFAVGLYAEVALTRFVSGTMSLDVDDDPITFDNETYRESHDLELSGGANHGWLGLGARVVFLP